MTTLSTMTVAALTSPLVALAAPIAVWGALTLATSVPGRRGLAGACAAVWTAAGAAACYGVLIAGGVL